ncbi:diacylglycerol kinase [Alteromonas sp. D210916BOD_24]|uniref:diacylglycerol kinase n=1 Tax=Alteromonas sp. D210916BOD_24 TaxID=3157618 RepID=UPI00399C64BB
MMTKRTGLARVLFATYYSMKGLRAAFLTEAAFRQELLALAILIPVALSLDITNVERVLLIWSLCMVIIVELLNTAIEKLCDHISTDMHELLGRAKDIGSAAVFICLLLAAFTWLIILL